MGRLWFFYIVLSVILKLFLISLNFSYDLIPSLPYLFLSSIIMSGLVFLLLDLPVCRAPLAIKKYVTAFSAFVYFIIVIVTMINIKLYMTMGTFITYELFQQVSDLDIFKSSLLKEADTLLIILLVSGAVYAAVTAGVRRLAMFRMHLPITIVATTAFLITSSALYSGNSKKGLHSIDRDPILEFTSSALTSGREYASAEKNTDDITRSIFSGGGAYTGIEPGCAEGMNVVLFILESTTPQYLSPEVTPNILALSGNALVLNSHYTTEPATLKAVYSLLTGCLPYVTRNWDTFLKESVNDVSFSQMLAKNGYYTEWVMPTDGKVYYEKKFLMPFFDRVSDYHDLKALYPSCRETSMGLEDNTLVWYMESFLEKHSKGKFFLALSSVNPHHPYDVSDKSYEVFGTATQFNMYKNALRGADDVIGKCYALLVKYGLEKNTLFVIVSDHGEAFYQHKRNYLHSIYLYEENVHTIAMFINPVLFPSRVDLNTVTSHIDIAPTILNLAGTGYGDLKPEGGSMLSNTDRRAVFFTSFSIPFWGCRDGKYKYIFNRRYNSEELYDLEADPFEKNNIAGSNTEICKKMNKSKGD